MHIFAVTQLKKHSELEKIITFLNLKDSDFVTGKNDCMIKAKILKVNTIRVRIVLMGMLCFLNSQGQSIQNNILISDISIISANSERIEAQVGYVLIEDDKITYSGVKKPKDPGNCKKINGKGKFLIPGLIDSHVHLANTAGFNGPLKRKYPEQVEAYFKQLPRSYLYHGFTTLIDVNNYNPSRIDQIKHEPLHPDIYTCGNQVQLMDDFMMEMEEYPQKIRYQHQFLHDKYNAAVHFPDSINLAEHTVEQIVAKIKSENGLGVKMVYEDEASGLVVSWAKPSMEILSELVREAGKQQLPVLLHAPSLEGHQIGLAAGIDIFAHGLWNWSANPDEFENQFLGEEHKTVLNQIALDKKGYQLTFRAIYGEKDLVFSSFHSDENLNHVYPKGYLRILKTKEGEWGKNKIYGRSEFLKRTNFPFYEALWKRHTDSVQVWKNAFKIYTHRLNTTAKFLEEANANFIFGSDTPAMNMFTNPPGYNGFLEMKHMFDAGISLETIFKAATYNNAKAFHFEDRYGSVEAGKVANLLILGANPLESIEAYDEIENVIIRGEIIERMYLSATHN